MLVLVRPRAKRMDVHLHRRTLPGTAAEVPAECAPLEREARVRAPAGRNHEFRASEDFPRMSGVRVVVNLDNGLHNAGRGEGQMMRMEFRGL